MSELSSRSGRTRRRVWNYCCGVVVEVWLGGARGGSFGW